MEKLIYMKTEYRKWIGKRLIDLRRKHLFTQLDIANKIDKKERAYAAYEAGRAEPSIYTLQRICAIYKLTVDKFLKDSPIITQP